jgi:hypothetical protein
MNPEIRSALVVLVLLANGCAFKEPEKSSDSLEGPVHGAAISLDWKARDNSTPDLSLKSARKLTQAGQAWSAEQAVTLPINPPETLVATAQLPSTLPLDQVEFLRAWLITESGRSALPAEFVQALAGEGGLLRASFRVSGLNAKLPATRSAAGRVEVEFFGSNAKITTIDFDVRTPPAAITVDSVSLASWRTAKSYNEAALKVTVSGTRLNLSQVIRLRNQEKISVEVRVPRRPGLALAQWENPMNHRDTGCGYAVDQSPRWTKLSDDLVILPLSRQLLLEAKTAVENPALKDEVVLQLQPDEELDLGLYATGSGASRWLDNGPLQPDLRNITVASGCYEVCGARECEHPGHDPRTTGFDIRPQICTCVSYETRRNQATITVGINRGDVQIQTSECPIHISARFADLDEHRDPEVRDLNVITGNFQVVRN